MTSQVHTLNEADWEKEQQLRVLDNVRSAFDVTAGSDENEAVTDDDSILNYQSVDMLSPGGHTDAQTLALMLQDQLDAINNEIRSVLPHQLKHLLKYSLCPKTGASRRFLTVLFTRAL